MRLPPFHARPNPVILPPMTQLTITLPPETAARIKHEADARGVSAEAVAAEIVEAWVCDETPDWEEDLRRLAEPGDNVPLDEAFDRFKANIATARAKAK